MRFPCLYLGDPDVVPQPNQPTQQARMLLQPFALLGQLRFSMDKTASGSLYGELIVEKK
jgi:hypothetical protein